MSTLKVFHVDKDQYLGKRISKSNIPAKIKEEFEPYVEGKQVIYFKDFTNPSIYGVMLREKGVLMQ